MRPNSKFSRIVEYQVLFIRVINNKGAVTITGPFYGKATETLPDAEEACRALSSKSDKGNVIAKVFPRRDGQSYQSLFNNAKTGVFDKLIKQIEQGIH